RAGGGLGHLALAVAAHPMDRKLLPAQQREALRRERAGYDVTANDDRVRVARPRIGEYSLECAEVPMEVVQRADFPAVEDSATMWLRDDGGDQTDATARSSTSSAPRTIMAAPAARVIAWAAVGRPVRVLRASVPTPRYAAPQLVMWIA